MERVYFYMTTHYEQNGLIVPPMALFLAKVRNLFFFKCSRFKYGAGPARR